jgi:hypothetical protein
LPFSKASFSFTTLLDPKDHAAYNAWHHLEHRPEYLALPEIAYGQRWVFSPRCAAASLAPDPIFRGFHYLNVYWFRETTRDALARREELAERLFQLGQRADVHLGRRPFMGTFSNVKQIVSPQLSLAADAIYFRPNRGIHLRLTEVSDPEGREAADFYTRQDKVLGMMVGVPGLAGVSVFASDSFKFDRQPASRTTWVAASSGEIGIRITLCFLDDDPTNVCNLIDDIWLPATPIPTEASLERVLFSGVLESIHPWRWEWFEQS